MEDKKVDFLPTGSSPPREISTWKREKSPLGKGRNLHLEKGEISTWKKEKSPLGKRRNLHLEGAPFPSEKERDATIGPVVGEKVYA